MFRTAWQVPQSSTVISGDLSTVPSCLNRDFGRRPPQHMATGLTCTRYNAIDWLEVDLLSHDTAHASHTAGQKGLNSTSHVEEADTLGTAQHNRRRLG